MPAPPMLLWMPPDGMKQKQKGVSTAKRLSGKLIASNGHWEGELPNEGRDHRECAEQTGKEVGIDCGIN
ncbi:hypothetical protein PAXRUDRAFT_20999 [Paxillus rubicundulus Ve08.2h10]|uniref:Uncharacterized protein n=1 Tax=Paxillus rubicundulus Ve08.2h10 TaxID=930991 RepID=A0A0D0D8B0_9AGAM|nr:hypothetical protein PAXRUDRAFT_20999 [Paxillus rubicundulus Ve08.2h10]